jgi:hypothetical protein
MVDFGWSLRGPAWITAARIMPHLIDAGWIPADAEEALTPIPAWADAPANAVTAYAASNARWFERAYRQRPDNQHRRRWHEITHARANHRAVLTQVRM